MKSKFNENSLQIMNLICAAAIFVLIVLQFIPYWSYDDMTVSINSYVWFPYSYSTLTSYFEASLGTPINLNSEVITPIVITFIGILILALQIWKLESPIAMIGAVLIGCIGIHGYLTSGMLRLGSSWVLHLGMCIVTVMLGIWGFMSAFAQHRK